MAVAGSASSDILNAIFSDWDQVDSRYIRPELYGLRKPLNTILLTIALLSAYPQIIGQDKINCMPHVYCNQTDPTAKCGQRADGYTISDFPYNHKVFVDDDCRKTDMAPYRFYLLYILIAIFMLSIIIQRLWRIIPDNNGFVVEFLKIVKESENDIGLKKLMNKIHMPKKDDSGLSESHVQENIQLIHHILDSDEDMTDNERHSLVTLIDRANDLRYGRDESASVSLILMCCISTILLLALTVVLIVVSYVYHPEFPPEFVCNHPAFYRSNDIILCVDLQSTFLTYIRAAFLVVLLLLAGTRLIMEIRIQYKIHIRHKGNVKNILRYRIQTDGEKTNVRKNANLLLLLVCLKLYDQHLFNKVTLLMSEQMNEVRRRQKKKQLICHLQHVIEGKKLACVRYFLRRLRILHVNDHDGSLQETVANLGDVEVNLNKDQLVEFRACVNAVIATRPDEPKMAALHRSALTDEPEMAEHLILEGADVDVRDEHHDTPLHTAMRNNRKNVAEALLKLKADVTVKNKNGQTPLDVASNTNHLWDLLYTAIRTGDNMEVILTLLRSSVDINAVRPDVGTLLHVAVLKNSSRIVKLLVDRGAALEEVDSRNRTPLQLAVQGASLKVVKILVEAGADVNATLEEDGKTVNIFDMATRNERVQVVPYITKILEEREETPAILVTSQ